jgi:hypothetical protein
MAPIVILKVWHSLILKRDAVTTEQVAKIIDLTAFLDSVNQRKESDIS